jgi:hypothetical protein
VPESKQWLASTRAAGDSAAIALGQFSRSDVGGLWNLFLEHENLGITNDLSRFLEVFIGQPQVCARDDDRSVITL